MALSLPVLTRLYDPSDFSLLAVYIAVISILGVVSCLRLNIAVPLPADDADGMALTLLSLLAASGLSLLLGAIVFIWPDAVASLLGSPGIAGYLWMIPVGVWVASVYTALQYWASRKRRFTLITRTRMTRAIAGSGTQLGFGVIAQSGFGLLFGHMIYGGMGIVGLLMSVWRQDRAVLREVTALRLKGALSAYRRFPIWSVPEALFNTAGSQLPIILIAGYLVGPEAGFLMLAMRIMGLPMGLIGSSVGQVYLAEARDRKARGELAAFTRRTMWGLFVAGGPPLVLVGVLSPLLAGFVFGEDWARAGVLVAWMTPWFVLQFVTSPVSAILHVEGRLVLAMILQALGLLLRAGAVLAALVWTPEIASEVFAVSGAVFYGVFMMVVYFVAGAGERAQ
ncbi:lipopolysaccharide biosynthesis protein [Roseovarius nubinhibens]|uniref:lipopolysaccharide biosynthesis protein n=1 Tax=Roseovarius nubinhibens TaxID=314263 RepID=UPI0030EE4830